MKKIMKYWIFKAIKNYIDGLEAIGNVEGCVTVEEGRKVMAEFGRFLKIW